jgi:hypothetical protein
MLMHAGRRSGDGWGGYAQFVQTFDWTDFYERWEGGTCLEWFATELRNKADVILIDSRTGVTEMGGVATQHLADAVIVLFGANLQNVENTAKMVANFACESVKAERGGRPLAVMAAPSRVDDQDSAGFLEFQKRYQAAFAPLPMATPLDGYSMEHMCIPYLAPFSYREVILFGDKQAETSARRIVEAYTRIAANMQRMAPQGSVLRDGPRPKSEMNTRVAILAASPDEQIAGAIAAGLHADGMDAFLAGSRVQPEIDISAAFRDVFCAVAIVTPAFVESTLMRTLLQVLTDLDKVIIPAIIQPVSPMPLLLADKAALDCSGDVSRSARLIRDAVNRWLTPQANSQAAEKRIFISYSQQDGESADRIAHHLIRSGFAVWWDRLVLPGAEILAEIQRYIDDADVMLVLLPKSLELSRENIRERSYFRSAGRAGRPMIAVKVHENAFVPYDLEASLVLDASSGNRNDLWRIEKAVSEALERRPNEGSEGSQPSRPPLPADELQRMAKHITNYLEANQFKSVSFERIRKNINPNYSDDWLAELIDQSPDLFRRVMMKGKRPGIGLAPQSNIRTPA